MSLFSRKQPKKKNENYERVFQLHEQASFLCYINDAYMEMYENEECVKLEGTVAFGCGREQDVFTLFNCNGVEKAKVTMLELYVGTNKVTQLEGGDKVVALYPKEQDPHYLAGDILAIMKSEDGLENEM